MRCFMWIFFLIVVIFILIVSQEVEPQLRETTCNLQHIDRLSSQYEWKIPSYCERIILHNASILDDDGAFLLNAIEDQYNFRDSKKRLQGVKVLDLSWNQLGQKTASILSNLVFAYVPLTHMYIGHNNFDEKDLRSIVNAIGLRKSENLFHVSLSGLSLSESLVADLVQAIEGNLHFVYLSIDGCEISPMGIEKLKIAVRARRENGIPIEVKKGSGSITLFDYPSITASSKQFTLDSKVRTRSIFNAPSVTKTTGSIKDCFNALGHDAAIFDEYGVEDHHGADKLSESDIQTFLPNHIER